MAQSLMQAAEGMPPIDAALTRQLMDQAAAGQGSRLGVTLSPRQMEALRWVSEGLNSKEIASLLAISSTTLKREFRKIFNSLGVNDRAHAIAEAYRMDLI